MSNCDGEIFQRYAGSSSRLYTSPEVTRMTSYWVTFLYTKVLFILWTLKNCLLYKTDKYWSIQHSIPMWNSTVDCMTCSHMNSRTPGNTTYTVKWDNFIFLPFRLFLWRIEMIFLPPYFPFIIPVKVFIFPAGDQRSMTDTHKRKWVFMQPVMIQSLVKNESAIVDVTFLATLVWPERRSFIM